MNLVFNKKLDRIYRINKITSDGVKLRAVKDALVNPVNLVNPVHIAAIALVRWSTLSP
jgi:hypothetical protein